ncbi:MAG: glycoside hydrolase family 78 protein, partial [Clostridiales bacterium]|nr:glycoside hydrolase family 78 protein [Clostridiales bacterium]
GWYMGRFGFFGTSDEDAYYGHNFRLIAEVHVEYEDGETAVFGTDESWTVWRSNITFCNLYDGEWRDDTRPPAPVEPAVLDKELPILPTDRYSLPVYTQERRKPVELIHTPAGEQVLDLGQNLAGGFCLRVRAAAGTAIRLQFGEVLQDGCFYNGNLRTAKAEYRYVSGGVERQGAQRKCRLTAELCPHFTYYGYRYVKIEGIDDLKVDDFTALVWYSDMEEAGTITTGHEKVNRLISNAHWGLKGNFLDFPTDCPQRDERMGWTGDAQVFSATACYFRDTYPFYRKYLHDMATEQADLEGKVPNVVPSFGFHDTACVWGDAAVIIPWNLYLFYGDERILQEQYDSMKGWVEYIRRTDGDNRHWQGGAQPRKCRSTAKEVFHFGDWLALDHPNPKPEQCMGGTDEGYIAYVYYARSAELVAKAAAVLGYREDAERYAALSRRIREDIQQEYFSPRGKCCVNTQTGMVLALQNDLSPRPKVVVQDLKKRFDQTEGKLQTGFVGTPLLCPTLTQCGLERLAFDLLLREEYPGWLYEVNHGATTVWERWNSIEPDGHISSTGMNSLNHYAYGSIVEWLFRDVAGLEPVEEDPGFRRVRLHPIYDLRLGRLELQYRSPAGLYRVRWEIQGRRTVTLEVSIPFGCRADLTLYAAGSEVYEDRKNPMFSNVENGVCHLTAGSYRVIYQANRPLGCSLTAHSKVWELFANEETAAVLRAAGVSQSDIAAQHWNDPFDTLGETKECALTPETIAQVAQELNKL